MIERQVAVAVGVILKGKKILLTKRHAKSRFAPGTWHFPGGKIEMFEEPLKALHREIQEELNIQVKVEKLLDVVSVILEEGQERRHVILVGFLCEYVSGEIKTENDEEWMWVEKNELAKLKMTPGSDVLIPSL